MTYRGEINMSKRQLSSRYKDLVDYVNKYKYSKHLADVLSEAIKEGESASGNCNELWVILNALYVMRLNDSDFSDLTKTIVDIYNDNYELEEPRCYWKLKINSNCGDHLYAFRYIIPQNIIGVKKFNGSVDFSSLKKFSKSKLTELLNNTDTNLTIDNFEPVEEIEHD